MTLEGSSAPVGPVLIPPYTPSPYVGDVISSPPTPYNPYVYPFGIVNAKDTTLSSGSLMVNIPPTNTFVTPNYSGTITINGVDGIKRLENITPDTVILADDLNPVSPLDEEDPYPEESD